MRPPYSSMNRIVSSIMGEADVAGAGPGVRGAWTKARARWKATVPGEATCGEPGRAMVESVDRASSLDTSMTVSTSIAGTGIGKEDSSRSSCIILETLVFLMFQMYTCVTCVPEQLRGL